MSKLSKEYSKTSWHFCNCNNGGSVSDQVNSSGSTGKEKHKFYIHEDINEPPIVNSIDFNFRI